MKELGQSFIEAGLLSIAITPWPVALVYGARASAIVTAISALTLFVGIALDINDRQKRKRHKP